MSIRVFLSEWIFRHGHCLDTSTRVSLFDEIHIKTKQQFATTLQIAARPASLSTISGKGIAPSKFF